MSEHSFPGIYVLYTLELAKRWGITADELLAGLGLDLAWLGDVRTRVPLSTIRTVLERAGRLTKEPAFGYYLGLQMRVSAHGLLGTIMLSAATMGEAIDLAIRFLAPVITTAFSLRLEIDGNEAAVVIQENADFGEERECIILAALITMWQIGVAMTGRDLQGYAGLALPEPSYYEQLLLVGTGRLRFNEPAHQLRFDAKMLTAKLTMADPVALKLALEQCERILASRGPKARMTERVRNLVIQGRGQPAPIERIALALHVSTRTLKRWLADEGTTFSAIVEEERRDQALLLLRSAEASVKSVAKQLGYANTANFTRAFHRWTGGSPLAYRRKATGLPEAGRRGARRA
jgi:AraC-like DNA-binding protein